MWFCTQWEICLTAGNLVNLDIIMLSETSQPHKASITCLLLIVQPALGMTYK